MARKKSGGAGGAVGAGVLILLGLLTQIPKDVWIALGVVGGLGLAIYLFLKSKRPVEEVSQPDPEITRNKRPLATPPRKYRGPSRLAGAEGSVSGYRIPGNT